MQELENNNTTFDIKNEIDYDNIERYIQEIREIATKIEQNGDAIIEAGTYCGEEDLSIQGEGMNKYIEECGTNHKEMAKKLIAYANSLEEGLKNTLR